MTKLRDPITYEATLLEVARLIGWDNVGAICGGVSSRHARRWSDHDCQTQIRAIDCERLDRAYVDAGGDHFPFHRLMGVRNGVDAAVPHVDACVVQAAKTTAREGGEAVAALLEVSANPTPQTIREARREAHELIDAATDALASLAKIEAGDNREEARLT